LFQINFAGQYQPPPLTPEEQRAQRTANSIQRIRRMDRNIQVFREHIERERQERLERERQLQLQIDNGLQEQVDDIIRNLKFRVNMFLISNPTEISLSMRADVSLVIRIVRHEISPQLTSPYLENLQRLLALTLVGTQVRVI
jgi:hypothetical protein